MDERIRVLQLIRDNKITPEEGLELLQALERAGEENQGVIESLVDIHKEGEQGPARHLRITNYSKRSNKRFTIAIPLSVIKFFTSIFPNALHVNINDSVMDREQLLDMIHRGEKGIIYREDSGKEETILELT
jgi:hypothetical protein